jgi:hypothetical protein
MLQGYTVPLSPRGIANLATKPALALRRHRTRRGILDRPRRRGSRLLAMGRALRSADADAGSGLPYGGEQGRSHVEGKMLMAVLAVGGFISVLLVLYAAERIVKARAQARRRRSMSQRLAAATARAEEQHQQRQAAERASQELTSVLPAIKRPPLTVPGMGPHDTPRRKTGRECPRQHQGRPALPARRSSGGGEHTVRHGSGAQP